MLVCLFISGELLWAWGTAGQVLHDGDVVSHTDRFGMTATRTPVTYTISINFFWTSQSRLALDHPFSRDSFIIRRELHDFSSCNVFI